MIRQLSPRRWAGPLKTLLTWGVLLSAGGAVWMWLSRHDPAASGPPAPREPRVVPVTVSPVVPRPVQHAVNVVGTLHGFEEVLLSTKVEGRVLKTHHDANDAVRPGEVLLQLDPVDYELAAKEARRALELELTRLRPGLADVPGPGFDLASVPMVQRAAAQEDNARIKLDRVRRLGSSVSQEERDNAERDFHVAVAESKQALIDAQATLASARLKHALLQSALERLKETTLRVPAAPADLASLAADAPEWTVCQRLVSQGEMLRPGAGAFKLAIVRKLKLKTAVPERFRGQVKTGQSAIVRVEANPGEDFTGSVARVYPSVERNSRTFEIEVHVPNADERLAPGSFARVSILTRVDSAAPTVPEEAVVRFAGVTKIFCLDGGRAREVPVKTGAVVEENTPTGRRTWVEVIGLLPRDAAVITSGQTQLAHGTPVRLRKSD